MRTRVIAQTIGGLVLAGIMVALFSPRAGSWWGNTFFGIPYSNALVLVPLAAASCAALATFLVLRNPSTRERSPFRCGVRIGLLAFLFYSVFHAAAYATFQGVAGSLAFAGLFVVFGGIFFMPICCLVAAAIETAARRHAAP